MQRDEDARGRSRSPAVVRFALDHQISELRAKIGALEEDIRLVREENDLDGTDASFLAVSDKSLERQRSNLNKLLAKHAEVITLDEGTAKNMFVAVFDTFKCF